jgi:hypothetical protein
MSAVAERDRHRTMILSPMKWPLFHLPLKRYQRGDSPQCAVLMTATEDETTPLRVLVNQTLYGPLPGQSVKDTTFINVDALLDDGWIVD